MSSQGDTTKATAPTERTKLEKGTEEYNLFHNLIVTVPEFLFLTARKVKEKFPQFQPYSTAILNTALQNAKRAQKRRENSEKKHSKKKQGKQKQH